MDLFGVVAPVQKIEGILAPVKRVEGVLKVIAESKIRTGVDSAVLIGEGGMFGSVGYAEYIEIE